MMNKRDITTRTFVLTAVAGSFVIMVLLAASTIWTSRLTLSATNEAVSAVSSFYLDAMADRRAKTIANLIDNNFSHMEKAIDIFADEGIETEEELRRTIGKIKSVLSLSRFALVDENDIVYTQYTTYTGGSRHEFLSGGDLNQRIINTVHPYGSAKQLCLVIPAGGLTIMDVRFKACFVQIDIGDIVDLLAFDDAGKTHFGLYSSNGANLSNTELGPVISSVNIIDATKDTLEPAVWETLRDNFAAGKAGNLTFFAGDTEQTISYVPIAGTDWEMAVLISESVIQQQIRKVSERNLAFSRSQLVFTLLIMLIFAGVLMLLLRAISRRKLEAEKENSKNFLSMANTDSLTGVRNKHAYTETEANVDRLLHNGDLSELAVVVCDINGLKHVNDTLGHAAGDKLIKDAAAMICDYFSRGSVFRIGGDEFVVILQGKGYETRNEVIEAFNAKAEANIVTNDVVVSIGASELTVKDKSLRDVFERADKLMYERKQALKAMGAKTRDN